MKKRDHYRTLGVHPTESLTGIRSAYLKLVKTHHPDLAGPESTRRLQEINEAYSVLSNPEARESYNLQLNDSARKERRSSASSHAESATQPVWIRSRRETEPPGVPSLAQFLESFFHGASATGFFGIPRKLALNLEVILSPEEAQKGGILPIPLARTCAACTGRGFRGPYPCSHCFSRGWLETGESVSVLIPPGISHGTVLDFPLAGAFHGWKVIRLSVSIKASSRG